MVRVHPVLPGLVIKNLCEQFDSQRFFRASDNEYDRIGLCQAGKNHQIMKDIYGLAVFIMRFNTALNMAVAAQDLAGLH